MSLFTNHRKFGSATVLEAAEPHSYGCFAMLNAYMTLTLLHTHMQICAHEFPET